MKNINDYKKDYDKLTTHKCNLSGKEALDAVKLDGYDLMYVNEQTEEICLAAVQENGYALAYVKEQTEAICLASVKRTCYALRFVREQTEEICLAAVQENDDALRYVNVNVFYKNHKKLIEGLGE